VVEAVKVEEKKATPKVKKPESKTVARKGIRRSTRFAFNNKEDALDYIEKTGGDTDIEEDDESDEEVTIFNNFFQKTGNIFVYRYLKRSQS
jgi:hypothetical protein